jgi:hypothetical protein
MNLLPRHIQIILLLVCSLFACRKGHTDSSQRFFRMGFQNSAPRADFNLYIQSLNLWVQRADAAMITTEVPWDSLFNGMKAEAYVINNFKGLAEYYRSKNFKLWVYIDPENGLNRASDADALLKLGKSIADPDAQLLYRRFVLAMDSILRPDHLGLALETNLIRAAAPDSIYQGIKKGANASFKDIRNVDQNVKISVSVQVDYAWGKLGSRSYIGIAQDFVDFAFIEELGLSSYPYFGFSNPEDLPANYYSKLVEGKNFPVFVSEGGWTSQSITGFSGQLIISNPQIQQRYITCQGQLLDQAQAIAVFQLSFTDIDLSTLPPSTPPNLKYFAYLGLVDISLNPRPSLSNWDALFKRVLKPGN